MKKTSTILLLVGLCVALGMKAANTKQTVSKVSALVTLTKNVDYCVTSDTPFGDEGMVNIVNTDHAVLILTKVKPSVAISNWLSHVQIDSVKAVNGRNCQVKIYDHGCIILPYGNTAKPLTVFSEQKYQGESCNTFGTSMMQTIRRSTKSRVSGSIIVF